MIRNGAGMTYLLEMHRITWTRKRLNNVSYYSDISTEGLNRKEGEYP